MNRFRKNLTFIRWIISYLFMLVIVLITGIGIYFYSYKIINEQQEDINTKILEKAETEIDRYIYVAKNTAVSLILDEDLEKIGSKGTNLSIQDRELTYRLFRNIQNKLSSSEELEHIFVWFLNGSTVVSDFGHTKKELFYSLYFHDKNIEFADIEQKFSEYADDNIMFLTNNSGKGEIIYITGKYGRGNDKSGAVIAVTISTAELEKELEDLKLNEKTKLIITKDGQIITHESHQNEEFSNSEKLEAILNGEDVDIKDKDGIKTIFHSDVLTSKTGISYILLTPKSLVAGGAGKIQLFASISFMICLTIGSIAAFYFAKYNYLPLQKVMKIFGDYKKGTGAKDEYDWLTNKASQIIENHTEFKNRYKEAKERLLRQSLFRIITLPYNLEKNEELENSLFINQYNLAVLIDIKEIEDVLTDRDLYRFVINNIVDELSKDKFKIMTIDITEYFVMVINSEKKSNDVRDDVEEIFDITSKFMLEKFGLKIKTFFGSWHSGIEGVHTSYLRARETLEYKDMVDDNEMIWYEDIKNRHMIYSYTPESEQKIINLIQISDTESAYKIIENIIDTNYHKREITASMKKCLIADIMGTLIKAVQQSGDTDFFVRAMDEYNIQNDINENKVLEKFMSILNEIKENSIGNKKKESDNLGNKVMDYVKENFANPDLNISITALHFGITPSYLSSLFKEQTGLSLLEYINSTRIEFAKELLKTDMSLNEISEKSGFRNSGALIRVFKKNTGLTPGQMRENFEK